MQGMSDETRYLTMAEAARHYPRPISGVSVWRHARKGVRCRDGSRVHLRHIRQGGRLLTTADDVRTFCAEVAQRDMAHYAERDAERDRAHPATSASPRASTDADRQRRVERAEARLRARGVMTQ